MYFHWFDKNPALISNELARRLLSILQLMFHCSVIFGWHAARYAHTEGLEIYESKYYNKKVLEKLSKIFVNSYLKQQFLRYKNLKLVDINYV